jgi:hypothetical protein
MIKAKHSWWAQAIIKTYLHSLVKRYFLGMRLVNEPPAVDPGQGLVLCPNHMSWWDGFLVSLINERTYKRRFFLMMEETQLRRFSLFREVGIFSVAPNRPKSLLETARYMQSLIDNPENVCVFFPEGELKPYSTVHPVLRDGIEFFLTGLGRDAVVIPLAMKIQFERESKPWIYLRFGQAHAVARVVEDQRDFKMDFQRNLEDLERAALSMTCVRDIL